MDWSVFILFLAACCAAAATGSMFPPGRWYRDLSKPDWTPPNWLFPIAWTLLYLGSAYAATRIAVMENNAHAMGFWAMQIALNTLWTPVFFGLRRLKAGAVVIAMLWGAVVGTMVSFFMMDWIAGLLFVPYVIWVSYAGVLNLSIVLRNPNTVPAA
ncbi:tryptophan-rich sensory protein [Maritalea mobilis]|uniref:Tryptophan-rich sensory protein n=1 Tax=[Roseibacterium] beibuensis TaxID=1193142 RepID=A0ABP9LCX4_9RHOB|nr:MULTISPECIES: TspO/MBR family protein [Alphaproteobacteria]MBY6201620.1 tryptophan-rich sensory protein [Maritalea mobilis]MCS6623170.1 tryptophan-rich sensory protein [Roseibacterium beibuensis]